MQRPQPSTANKSFTRRPVRADRSGEISIQLAVSGRGVPHARSLRRWAELALGENAVTPAARRERHARDLAIRIVGNAESRRLNATWRGKDKPTNVLSFPASPTPAAAVAGGPVPLGDLVICAPVVAREAREQGKTSQAHWAHMVVHGVLHLLGYDHEIDRDADVMEAREITLLANLGYPNPYA